LLLAPDEDDELDAFDLPDVPAPADPGRVITIVVDPGDFPGALPITSIVVLPTSRCALAVNTPFPTAAGWPSTSTVAVFGVTVPRTVTLLALITLPFGGDVTCTTTAAAATVLVEVEVVADPPQPHKSPLATAGKKTVLSRIAHQRSVWTLILPPLAPPTTHLWINQP